MKFTIMFNFETTFGNYFGFHINRTGIKINEKLKCPNVLLAVFVLWFSVVILDGSAIQYMADTTKYIKNIGDNNEIQS